MGQAKLRGTFEQRRAAAIAAGHTKANDAGDPTPQAEMFFLPTNSRVPKIMQLRVPEAKPAASAVFPTPKETYSNEKKGLL